MAPILETRNLTKRYGSTLAVHNFDLVLEENVIYGLLGQNGAGKSTLLNLLAGNLFPDRGEITVFGEQLLPGHSPKGVCFISEKGNHFNGFRIKDIFAVSASFHPNWDNEYAFELLDHFRLDPNKKYRQLSRGMESLVGIIIGLAAREPLTILDEPVLGFDVLVREKFYQALMEDYANHPRTFVLSTHLIDEVEHLIEKVCIIDGGEKLLSEDMETLQSQAHFISGKKGELEPFVADQQVQVLHRESIGNSAIISAYGTLTAAARQEAKTRGLEIEGMPFQKFFAYYIKGREPRV